VDEEVPNRKVNQDVFEDFCSTSAQWGGEVVGGTDIGVEVCILLAYDQPNCSSEVARRRRKCAVGGKREVGGLMEGVCLACCVCADCHVGSNEVWNRGDVCGTTC